MGPKNVFDACSAVTISPPCANACVGASKLMQSEGRASDDSVMEATDRAPEPDDDRAVIYLYDRRCLVREVTRPDLVVDHDVIPDAQLRKCRGCGDSSKQLPPRLHCVCDGHQVGIEIASSDRVQ